MNQTLATAMQYYVHNDSARILRLLREYIISGSGLLVLSGPHGSGKSQLLEQFANNLDTSWQLCRLSALENPNGQILLARIARHFHIQTTGQNGKLIDEQMREYFASSAQSYIPVVTIDNAERLSDESLMWLWRLATPLQGKRTMVRIILIGNVELCERMSRLQLPCQQSDMQPLDVTEVESYLRHRLHNAGYTQPFPFTNHQLKKIKKESGGWIGRIDSVAHEILIAGDGWRSFLPIWLALLGIGVFVGLYLLRGDMQNSLSSGEQLAEVSSTLSVEDVSESGHATRENADSATGRIEIPERLPALPNDTNSPASSQNTAHNPDEAVSDTSENHLSLTTPTPRIGERTVASVDDAWIERQPDANFTLQLMVASAPGGLMALRQQHAGGNAPMAVAGFTQGGRTLYMLLQGSYATRAEAEQAAEIAKTLFNQQPWIRRFDTLPKIFKIAESSAVSSGKESLAPPALSSISTTGAAWIWSRAPGHFTVQLMGSDQKAKIYEFLERNKPATPLAVVHSVREGRAWYLLVMGEYASPLEAKSAISALPVSMREGEPWPRTFASLQDLLVLANRGQMEKSALSGNSRSSGN